MQYELTVNIRHEPGCAIVTPAGELDIATAPQLREFLLALLPAHPALVIDLDQLSFCGATGLGVLAGAANRARASGTSLHLVCSRPAIRRLFELTGLARRLPLARTLSEVLAALPEAHDIPDRKSRAARPGHRQARRHRSGTTAGRGRPPAPGPALAPSEGDRHDRPA
jgi:anti-sigma B factor antagonist